MKILFLNYEFPPLGGGAGNATSYLLREFSKIPGLEIDLVTSSTGSFRIEKKYPNVTIHYLDIGKKGNLHYQSMKDLLVYSKKALSYSKGLIEKNRYDLCHAFFGIPCGFIAMRLGIPYIVSLRGSDVPFYNNRFFLLDKLLFQRISRKVWKNSRRVVALSHDLKNLAMKTASDQDISIIYNGIDTDEFSLGTDVRQNEKHTNILFVGRLIERKGLGYLLEAFRNISKGYPDSRLIVTGDGPLRETYQKYLEDNRLEDKVEMLGIVSHDKIKEIYQKSHIFVLPSLNEALGNVTQEALATGLAIITTDTGAAEIIQGNGLIIEKKSSASIEEALKKLLDDKTMIDEMSKKSRQLAEKMDWKAIAEKYLEIYKEASSEK
ncbi:MAG: glycosyltransferase family 4 protein [Candidatus Moranbacteria bacterium]|nr:glycosyltransferase family 4 protein [Candidatus Moranbacteria bacterium]